MEIDPVLRLIEDLRNTDSALQVACKSSSPETVELLLSRIAALHKQLCDTVPTSSIGGGELIALAAQKLPRQYSSYASHLNHIAGKLRSGQRAHGDLVWLRAVAEALALGACGEEGRRSAALIGAAIAGISRPVMIYRAIRPVPRPAWEQPRLR